MNDCENKDKNFDDMFFKFYGGITKSSFAGKFDDEVYVKLFYKKDENEDTDEDYDPILKELVSEFIV